jgi:2-polyprenyl-3-methyl-5-hydroxy-6-metoxy-1,4-benzoquinol methylase
MESPEDLVEPAPLKAATLARRPRSRVGKRRRPTTRAAGVEPPAVPVSPQPDRILQMAWGFAPPLIIGTALDCGIFDLLDRSPQTAEATAERTGCSVRGTKTLLDALVALECLVRQGECYALTEESAVFLVSTRPSYYGTYFTHMTRQLLPQWMRLPECVRTGRPVLNLNEGTGAQRFFAEFVESLFPLKYKSARLAGRHLGVGNATSRVSVLDVGAGSGVWGIALAHQSPHVRIHAVDWPAVLDVTRRVALRQGVADRLTTIAGDLLEVDLGKGHHVAIIGQIFCTEGLERSRRLLRRIFEALAPGGTVVISEFMPNEERTGPADALVFAVNMLVHTELGNTFTFGEISSWLSEAGFTNVRLLEAPAPSPLVLADRP